MTAAEVVLKQPSTLFQQLGSLYSHYAKRHIKIGAKKKKLFNDVFYLASEKAFEISF